MRKKLAILAVVALLLALTGCSQPVQETSPCQHSYSETVEKEASVVVDGVKKYTCTACGEGYTEAIPATKSLKLLAIGNSFSDDSFAQLWEICKAGGVEELVLGHLMIGGSDIATHWYNLKMNEPAYIYFKNTEGVWNQSQQTTAQFGLTDEQWDVVTIQQSSHYSGQADTFRRMGSLLDLLQEYVQPETKFYWHMTWAYQSDSDHWAFPNYGSNQLTMYNAITQAVRDQVLPDTRIAGVIPTGTAIQNLRTSFLGDTLTRDGYHLKRDVGSYVAGLTWYAALTGGTPDLVDWAHMGISHNEKVILACKEAAANALKTPYAVTESTVK